MALPDEQRQRLDAIVQRMTADGQSPDAIRAVVSDFTAKYAAPENERTWGDTLTDALPLAGGVLGGVVGAPGGIPGIMAGSAVGGGAGTAARRIVRGEPITSKEGIEDIYGNAALEGLTAGAFGAAGKIGTRIIRGIRPVDVAKGVAANVPFFSATGRSIKKESAERLARQAFKEVDAPMNRAAARQNVFDVSSKRNVALRADELDDVLTRLRQSESPMSAGGAKPLRAGQNLPVVNPERSGGMISTQPDKWGASSIHRAEDFIDRSRLVDRARPVVDAPPTSRSAAMADDAFSRNVRGNPQQQELLRALLKQQAEPPIGNLTKAGRSMLTDDDAELFAQALRDMKANLSHVPQSRTMGRY